MSRRIVILTGVSGSGKTSIQNELLKIGWVRPINFSTRIPRARNAFSIGETGDYISEELNEYVFLDKSTFARKLINGDFMEVTQYGGNFYGVSKHSFLKGTQNLVVILDPVGRAQIMEALSRNGIEYESYYINISQETQIERLRDRGDPTEEITKRKRDFDWFHPSNKCIRLNANINDVKTLAEFINKG